ncbi:M64 family metallo-endopeptidase, partial [Akkermansiaceae bacterium]|nr:M64 family metallo-endopeptidase [Akkermansiaceae bacterium]
MGDGFDSSAADQNTFIDYVNNTIVNDLFVRDIHPEIRNSINLYRVDTISEDSGVTQMNADGEITTSRDTALDYRFSGEWARCWLEPSRQSNRLVSNILAAACPQADLVIVVLNEAQNGGCNRGTTMAGTLASPWSTVAHEFGHLFGELQDEYGFNCTVATNDNCSALWTGGTPSWIKYNQTVSTSNQGGKWEEWIPSWRTIPTPYNRSAKVSSEIADRIHDVSLFAGATGGLRNWRDGIWRPSITGRMDSNSRLHNPIGYDGMRQRSRVKTEATFRKNLVGDFDGDGRDDLVLHDGRQLSLYLSRDRVVGALDPLTGRTPRGQGASVLEKTWFHNDRLWSDDRSHSWKVRPGDRFYVADFDGDGRDDLYVFNSTSWTTGYCGLLKSEGNRFQIVERYDRALPGFGLWVPSDVYVGDFNGDGREDFLIYNGESWNINYLNVYLSEGNSVRSGVRINGVINDEWFVGDAEKFHIGDFNGDGKDDFLMAEQSSWDQVYLRVYTYDDAGRKYVQIGDGNYGTVNPGGNVSWALRRNDNILVGDFDGDGKDDVALHNGQDWNNSYLAYFSVTEGAETLALRWQISGADFRGWHLTSGDRFYVGNVDGDGDDDLIIFNGTNWGPTYLGMAKSLGQLGDVSATWQDDWIGGWHLGEVDDFKVCDFAGGGGWADLFVYNDDWFGCLRSRRTAYQLASFNYKYI